MSSNFECFVTINDKKQTIIVKKNVNCVTFGDVYHQICKICSNVSIESHVFEIFDVLNFSFTRLTDFKTKIKCLSRIRVSPSFRSISLINSHFESTTSQESHSMGSSSDTKRFKSGNTFRDNLIRKHNIGLTSTSPSTSTSTNRFFKPMDQIITAPQKAVTSHSSITNHNNDSFSKKFKPLDNADKSEDLEQSSDSFECHGLSPKGKQIYCQFCLKFYPSMAEAVKHISTFEHLKNSREDCYETIDKQFLTEIKDKKNLKKILYRRIELNKFNDEEKRKMIDHGIRVKDGSGPESYVCHTCDRFFESFINVKNHYRHYLNVEYRNKSPINEDLRHKEKKTKQSKEENKNFKVPEEVADDVKRLVRHGFVVSPVSKHKFILICRFCECSVKTVSKAENHLKSEEHKWLSENPFRGIDKLIVTESYPNNDIEAVLARIDTVRELSYSLKERFLSHGLKVKNGIGCMAYVCTKCNALFERLQDVEKHLKEFEKLKNSLLDQTSNGNDDECLSEFQMAVLEKQMKEKTIEKMLRNEGIKYKKYDESVRKQLSSNDKDIPHIYYYCVFCNINFHSKETAIYHLNRIFHKKIRRGEYMTPIEAMFCAKTDRIDEYDVAFARMEALNRLDNKTKIELRDKGIRLKDGIGSDAYICLKCNASIASETIDSALFSLIRHTKSRDHLRYASH